MNREVDYQESLERIKNLENELEELQNELEELHKSIAWMKDSKFWKLRNRLFGLYEKLLGKEYQPGITLRKSALKRVSSSVNTNLNPKLYQVWRKKNVPDQEKLDSYKTNKDNFKYQPKITLLIPTYNTPSQLLNKTIESVFQQVYENWELCIVDNFSNSKETVSILKKLEVNSKVKVKYRENTGHRSESLNSALELAEGEFTLFYAQDDLLTPDALYEIVAALNQNFEIDIIYSDEDKIDESDNFSDPHFKPEWCPDNLLSRNYFGHLVLVRTSLLKGVGGFRKGYEGSEDYDLLLRITEKSNRIHHIPKVLYHKRTHNNSITLNRGAKSFAYDAEIKALEDTLIRRNLDGEVKMVQPGYYNIYYKVIGSPKISIVIPAKNKASLTSTCIDSIFKQTIYTNFEVILIDNGSNEKDFQEMVDKYLEEEPERFIHCYHDIPFNFSKLINFGVKQSNGEYIVLLNNDTEIISNFWLNDLVSNAQRKDTGVVGAKLLYSNSTIQHAGVVIGLGGLADHSFVGHSRYSTGYFCYPLVISNYSALTAACFIVNKELFSRVNGFDEDLAVEFNDVDFCLKVKELGYNNVYIPYVELYHHESISRGNPLKDEESTKRHLKECGIIKKRWKKYIDKDPCFNPNLDKNRNDFSFSID